MSLPACLEEVPSPAFLLDLDVVKRNARKMLDTSQRLATHFRPHMKTHKTIEGGIIATGETKRKIAVSTIKEAEFFADHGFDDILYAYPITADKIPRCAALADRLDTFLVMFDGPEAIKALDRAARPGGKKWHAYLEVDLGYGRTGVEWDSEAALTLAQAAVNSPVVELEGLYAHCGGSYDCRGVEELKRYGEETCRRLISLSDRLKAAGIECRVVGTGSTPSLNQPVDQMSVLSELHPGNYIFNDYEQHVISSCGLEDIACCVATRVISHKPSCNQMVVDCGFLALGHDGMQVKLPDKTGFCLFKDHPELRMVDMSQELGKVRPWEGKLDFSKFPIGTLLYIYPWHSCLTAALHDKYYVHEGKKIVAVWTPVKGW